MKGNFAEAVRSVLEAHPEVLRVVEVPAGADRPQTKAFLVTPKCGRDTFDDMHAFCKTVTEALPKPHEIIPFRDCAALWFAVLHLKEHCSCCDETNHQIAYIDRARTKEEVELRLLPDDCILEWVKKGDNYCINYPDLQKMVWLDRKLPWIAKVFRR